MYSPGGKTDRQYGSLDQIRGDHVRRYLFAAGLLKGEKVLDMACGCGYGSFLLHGAGNEVTGVDICQEAIDYANKHYQGPNYLCQRAEDTKGRFDAVVSFETLEHLERPDLLLAGLDTDLLISSVPNENLTPFNPENFKNDVYPHKRHYTPDQFEDLLKGAGFKIKAMFCQKDKYTGEVVPGSDGVFLLAYACR